MKIVDRINQGNIVELEGKEDLSLPEKLDIISRSGNASKYFSEGDTIDVNGITFEICAFNHYKDNRNNINGITFVSSGLVGDYQMNLANTNKDGYFESALRDKLEDLFYTFPQEWQSVIKKSKLIDSDEQGRLISHSDYFFIPSAYEIYGEHISSDEGMGWWKDYISKYLNAHKQEGTPIPYLYEHRVKGKWYWTRSADLSDSANFWYVTGHGGLSSNSASNSRGVSLCWSI